MSGEGFTITGSDLFSGDFAVSSVTDTAGAEYITGSLDLDVSNFASSFDVPYEDLGGFGPYQQAGSLAGDKIYNDFFNAGGYIDGAKAAQTPGYGFPDTLENFGPPVLSPAEASAAAAAFGEIGPGAFGPEVVDRVGVITPGEVARNAALAFGEIGPGSAGFSLTQFVSQIQTDFTGFLKGAQEAQQFLNRAAPVVNLVSGILRVPNPLAPIAGLLNQATAVAQAGNAVAGLAGDATRSLRPTTGAPVPVRGADGLFTVTLPADQVQTGAATPVVVDAQTQANYDAAQRTVRELGPQIQIASDELFRQDVDILRNQQRIAELQAELENPAADLTLDERGTREITIQALEAETALLRDERAETLRLGLENARQFNAAEQTIATVDRSAISAPPVRGADGLFTVTLPANQVQTSTATPVVVDAQTQANYDAAQRTVRELGPQLRITSDELVRQDDNILRNQRRIDELQAELETDAELNELTIEQRGTREIEIQALEAETALLRDERAETFRLGLENASQFTAAERIIATVDRSAISAPPVVTSAPGGAPEGALVELSDAASTDLRRRTIDPRLVPLPPNAPPPDYDAARRTVQELAPTDQILRQQVVDQGIQIKDNKDRIAELQAELDNDLELSQLTLEQRGTREIEIQALQAETAVLEEQQVETARLALETSRQLDAAREVIATTDASAVSSAGAVRGTGPAPFSTVYNPTTNTWSILDTATGTTVSTGLTEQQARDAQIRLAITAASIALKSLPGAVGAQDPRVSTALQLAAQLAQVNTAAGSNIVAQQNAVTAGLTDAARNQAAVRSLRNNKAQSTDWRVRLRLAPNSNYLYNEPSVGPFGPTNGPGILAALRATDGVIFPYTPSIETAYKANYEAYDLTHSNYRGYFYRNSYVDVINLRATFTAQDTNEANYLLAVIHFFRSATKMFYGQDASLRGAPPPLVYLNGYGNYQFNEHPCVISQFNYNLPPDVDYIRCQSWLNNNTNLQLARLRSPIANNPLAYSVNRLLNSRLLPGAKDFRPSLANNLADGEPTYVPTKMEISISLLPIQSRAQVSQNFSVKGFADGNLLKGGYW